MRRSSLRIATLAFLAAALAPGVAPAAPVEGAEPEADTHWGQWRGPASDGVAPGADPPVEWSEDRNVTWKIEVPGAGQSSPIVWGDAVFLTTAVPVRESDSSTRLPDPEGRTPHPSVSPSTHVQALTVISIDRETGEERWSTVVRELVPHDGTHIDGSYASGSPVTDGERLYAHFGSGGLYALDLDGSVLWQHDLGDMVVRRGFGEGASPTVWEDLLVVLWDHQGDSFLVVFDAQSGVEKWRVARDEITSWTTPLVVEVDGGAQIVTAATNGVRAYDLGTGDLLWNAPGVTLNAIPSPVAADGLVFLMSGFRGNVLQAVRLDRARGSIDSTDAIVWSLDRDTPYVPSPLLHDGILYFTKSNSGILSAYDAASGGQHYLERLDGVPNVYASPVAAGGRIYIAGRDGATAVVSAGHSFEVLSVNELDEHFDASPAVVGGEIYLRGQTSLYRISR